MRKRTLGMFVSACLCALTQVIWIGSAQAESIKPIGTVCTTQESAEQFMKLQGDSFHGKIGYEEWRAGKKKLKLNCKEIDDPAVVLVGLDVITRYDEPDSRKLYIVAEDEGKFYVYAGQKVPKGAMFDICTDKENANAAFTAHYESAHDIDPKTVKAYSSKHCQAGKAKKDRVIVSKAIEIRNVPLPVTADGMHASVLNIFELGEVLEKGKVVYVITGKHHD